MKTRIRKDDIVIATAGKQRFARKTGRVLRLFLFPRIMCLMEIRTARMLKAMNPIRSMLTARPN